MKIQSEIENDMIETFASRNTTVTNFVVGSVMRSIFTAIAGVLAEIWSDIVQAKRKMFIDTASAADLDLIGGRRGVTRRGSSKSSAVLVFNGAVGTVIPIGTIAVSSSGIEFSTKHAITLGEKNSIFDPTKFKSISLGDAVIAESTIEGMAANVPARTTKLASPMVGVDAMTNPAPAAGGSDSESDYFYSMRIKDQISILNNGTQAYYEAIAKNADVNVLRAIASRDKVNHATKLALVKNSGALFSAQELNAIAFYVESQHRATEPVTCSNITFAAIGVEVKTTIKEGSSLTAVYQRIVDQIGSHIDWKTLPWGSSILSDDLIWIVKNDPEIENVDLGSFFVNGTLNDVAVESDSLPRLISFTITDTATATSISHTLSQSYMATM